MANIDSDAEKVADNQGVVNDEPKALNTKMDTPLPQKDEPANTPLRAIYAIPYVSGRALPSIRDGDSIVTVTDFSNSDLRGLSLSVDLFENGPIHHASFDNSDLTGFTTTGDTEFYKASFKSAILRDTYFERQRDSDYTDAVIPGCTLGQWPIWPINQSKNYKEKDLSGCTIPLNVSYNSFNLSNSHIVNAGIYPAFIDSMHYNNANITGAVIMGIDYLGREKAKHVFPYLRQTKNFKERNLGSVVFVNLDLETTNFSGQTLGYFDCCDLTHANLHNAYFHAKDERAIMPFSRVIPTGFTACEVTVDQFRTTRNYKIWKETGIPEIEKIRITPDNARYYNFKIIDGKVFPKNYFKLEEEMTPTEDVFVYKVGNIHVTEEIAHILEKERNASAVGEARGKVLTVLETRFGKVPQDIEQTVRAMMDSIALESLVELAKACQSLEEFAECLK